MEIVKQCLGMYKANCYVLKEDGQALVIDPGLHPEKVIAMIGDANPLAVLLTHGHADHICAVQGVWEKYHLPVYIHLGDKQLVEVGERRPAAYKHLFTCPYEGITEGTYTYGPFTLDVLEMPGHSAGHVLFQMGQHLFTGDTLFKDTIGVYDEEDEETFRQTMTKIYNMDSTIIVHPGHGDDTTIGREKVENHKWLRFIGKE